MAGDEGVPGALHVLSDRHRLHRALEPMGQALAGRPQGHLDGEQADRLRRAALDLAALYADGAADTDGPCGHERRRQIEQDGARAQACWRLVGALDALAGRTEDDLGLRAA